jgi:hypothetical protein
MTCTIEFSEQRYWAWYNKQSREDLGFLCIVGSIWEMLCAEISDAGQEDAFHKLICFVMRVRQKQDNYIRSSCYDRNVSYWESVVQRAGDLYQRVNYRIERLKQKQAQIGKEAFLPYLYTTLEHNLIECNNKYLNELNSGMKNVNNPRELEYLERERRNQGFVGKFCDPRVNRTMIEIMYDIHLRDAATRLYDKLISEWDSRQLNVLCHWLETVSGVDSERLCEERRDNRDQLHSRITKHFRDYADANNIETDVMRMFFHLYAQKLCQTIPVCKTYKIRKEVADDTHI